MAGPERIGGDRRRRTRRSCGREPPDPLTGPAYTSSHEEARPPWPQFVLQVADAPRSCSPTRPTQEAQHPLALAAMPGAPIRRTWTKRTWETFARSPWPQTLCMARSSSTIRLLGISELGGSCSGVSSFAEAPTPDPPVTVDIKECLQ